MSARMPTAREMERCVLEQSVSLDPLDVIESLVMLGRVPQTVISQATIRQALADQRERNANSSWVEQIDLLDLERKVRQVRGKR